MFKTMGKIVKKMRKTVMKEKIYIFPPKSEFIDIIHFQMCGITYPNKNYLISRPNSSIACFEYVEKGTGVVNIGNTKFYPSEGDSYFLPVGLDQYYFSDTEKPWKKYFINLAGPLVDSFIEGYKLSGKYHFTGLNLKNEFLKIIELAKDKNNDHSKELIGIIHEILFKMHNHLKTESKVTSVAQEMKDFLNSQLETPFKMQDLCKYISKSESQTIKIFKKEYGITPYQYVLSKKIGIAKNLLKNTNMSIREIAQRLGFADEYYFSNIFKQKTGMRPSNYKKN